ncbi:hypothetical protein [Saccharopolyspora taberi]|uniref:Uncharacterized protein n=1 Tax=Saccharopolyspora taberi TaxID=60895 RepID=A0ABN3VJZ9_9PSEU
MISTRVSKIVLSALFAVAVTAGCDTGAPPADQEQEQDDNQQEQNDDQGGEQEDDG